MSLRSKLILSTVLVLLLVSLGGVAVLVLSWQREQMIDQVFSQLPSVETLPIHQKIKLYGLLIPGAAMGSGVVVFLFMVWNTWMAERRRIRIGAAVDEFGTAVNNVVHMLSSAAAQLDAAAQSMDEEATKTQGLTESLARDSLKVDSSMKIAADAERDLSSSIDSIRGKVHASGSIAGKAVQEAQASTENVRGLVDEAQKISAVVTMISDIAIQTNLLALNATIEAARAGDAGKGFAVVANEVKNLSGQTAEATEEITSRIAEMQGATSSSAQAIEAFSGTISQIEQVSAEITEAVDRQNQAAYAIARNVQEAAQIAGAFARNVGEVTEAASKTGKSAAEVLDSADAVARQSTALRDQVDSFLARLRQTA